MGTGVLDEPLHEDTWSWKLSSIIKDPFIFLLFFSPAWWFLGADFIVYFLVSIPIYLTSASRVRVATPLEIGIFICAIILALSGLNSIIFLDTEPGRLLAATYNLLLFFTGAAVIKFARYKFSENLNYFRRISFLSWWIAIFASIVCIVGVYLSYKNQEIAAFPTLLGFIVKERLPGIMSASQTVQLARPDWLFDIMIPRGTAMGPYPNATAIMLLLLGVWAWIIPGHGAEKHPGKTLALVRDALFITLVFVAIATTASRAVIIGALIGLVISLLIYGGWVYRSLIAITTVGIVIELVDKADVMLKMRGNSSDTRFENYTDAWDLVSKINPILGLGVKPQGLESISVGSHSTLVSEFTKGGMLEFLAILITLFIIPTFQLLTLALFKKVKSKDKQKIMTGLLIAHASVISWMIFEDIDAPALASFLIFFHFGLVQVIARSPHLVSDEVVACEEQGDALAFSR